MLLPGDLLDSVAPPRMRPLVFHELRALLTLHDECLVHLDPIFWPRLEHLYETHEDALSRTPELARVGHLLLDRKHHTEARVLGCIWLTLFPDASNVARLAELLHDATEEPEVRDQAAWTLGYRQLEHRDDSVHWSPEAVALADDALLRATRERDLCKALPKLLEACRHVSAESVLDRFAEDPVAFAGGIEAFASPALAKALLAALPRLPSPHAPRLIRLVGHALGAEAAEPLLRYAETAPPAEKVEALMTALSVDAARTEPALDAFLRGLAFDGTLRARAAWHRAHPGLLPTVLGLRVARRTAVLAPHERAGACLSAARSFAELAAVERYPEGYLYGMWRHVAFRSCDADAIVRAIDAAPDAVRKLPRAYVTSYLRALAACGRFRRLAEVARERDAIGEGTWELARHGRPYLALTLRRTTGHASPEAVAGEALALFLAGRPDLTARALAFDVPRAEPLEGVDGAPAFPGPDEAWRVTHEPARWPALTALVAGLPALLERCTAAPPDAEPDALDPAVLGAYEERLRADVVGATVCLLGSVADRSLVESELTSRGARIVSAPFPGTHFYVAARDADPQIVTRLEQHGARRLPWPLSPSR